MADIELVIKIPEEEYNDYIQGKGTILYPSKYIHNGNPLPKGHGRLIDADALYEQYAYADCNFDMAMEYTPTIIEADKESE